ncbi:PQQ-binding-like beta-propeller repeat protein [Pseudonocardia sp. NPDC049154]|uniref:PQQ-binding-like beta-propeller repeat protein n=1 Tax=Pseudonocardia sp. NPDC049154 TaxID=3155501 RepID=UPI0033CE1471
MPTRRRVTPALTLAALLALAACTSDPSPAAGPGGPRAAAGFRLDEVVTGSTLHSINGLTLRPDGRIGAANLAGETISEIDPRTGAATPLVPSPDGRSDDVVLNSAGDVLWTDPLQGTVETRGADGTVRTVAGDLPGVNSIAFDRAHRRLFVGQTFFGDALWEIDPTGAAPKRLVARDIGQPNAFAFGPDGQIYAPVGKRKAVIRIDPETGTTAEIATGFTQPVSVRFDSLDRLYVLDGATGELIRVDPATGAKQTVATLPAADDNMVIGPDDHAYVSNMADSSVLDVNLADGAKRVVTQSPLAFPTDIAAGTNAVFVADNTALRTIDPATGEVRELARRLATEIQFPSGISVHDDHLVLTSALIGAVQVLDTPGEPLRHVEGFLEPSDALELNDGALVVAEPETGRLIRVDDTTPRTLAENLGAPTGLALAGDGRVLATDATGGRLLGVEPQTGATTMIADQLGAPRSVAVAPDGAMIVLDADGRVLRLEPGGGAPTTLAEGLAVGYLEGPHPRSGGVAVTDDGTVFVTADKENSVYAIHRT